MRSKFFKGIGLYLCGACVMPLYVFWQNFPLFRMRDVGVVIGSCWLVCWLVSKVVRRCIRGEEEATFWLFAMYSTFWLGRGWYGTFIHKCLFYFPFLSQHRWLRLSIPALLLAGFCWLFLRKAKKWLPAINSLLALVQFCIVGIFLFRTGVDAVVVYGKQKEVGAAHPKSHLPNIYHILLDAHPNQKAMELLGGDLRPFYRELESLGFMTFPESMSNYWHTARSLASMCKLDYLDPDENEGLKIKNDLNPKLQLLHASIRDSRLHSILKGHYAIQWYFQQDCNGWYHAFFEKNGYTTPLSKVCRVMFNRSILSCFTWYERLNIHSRKEEISTIFSHLVQAKETYGPVNHFFYAHILSPHAPLIYGSRPDRILAYTAGLLTKISDSFPVLCENVYGIDQAILPVLKTILAQYQNEPIKPIILLHSDHSLEASYSFSKEYKNLDTTYGNLLAIYMPDSWKKDAQNLTFINLYRFLLNHLLDLNLPYIKENKQVGFEE